MKQFYWLIVGISLLSLASCKEKVKMARDCQTVKIDTVISADEQTYLQYPGKVKAAQDIVDGHLFSVDVGGHQPCFQSQRNHPENICGERCTRKPGTTASRTRPDRLSGAVGCHRSRI